MTQVLTCTYEVTGSAAVARVDMHYGAVRVAHDEWYALAKEFGATAVRPGYGGKPPRTFCFNGDDPPSGWLYVSRPERGKVEAKPHKGTKIGKAAAAKIVGLHPAPSDEACACEVANFTGMPSDGRSVYFATLVRTMQPTVRYFVRLPRTDGDGWAVPDGLTEVPESELHRAIEAHNAAALKAREAA